MIKLSDFIDNIEKYDIEYRIHATRRMFKRDIYDEDIEQLLKRGEIIERYNDDVPLPSLLISGITSSGRPLHLVAGINNIEKIIVITTTYEPDHQKWSDNFMRRVK